MRPVDHRILVRGVRYSAVPILSLGGIHDVFLLEGTVTLGTLLIASLNFSEFSDNHNFR